MKKHLRKRALSILLSVLIAISGIVPAMTAFAGDGVEGYYDLQIFYKDTNTIVPTYQEDGVTEWLEYLHEGDELALKHQLIDSVWPDNAYVKWYSENPVLVDVTNDGVVKAFDSSKGAVIKSWINNEVRPIPIIGKYLGDLLEKALFNDKINIDTLDADAIVTIVTGVFGSDSFIADYIEAYEGQLVDSLREYLDKVNTPIVCQLYSADGTLLAQDSFKVTVLRCEEWYANFLPNGTHITNKKDVNTTQAKGGEVQLWAITTPQRLGYGTEWSVKSSSIFSTGKVVATVNDGGLVKFKNVGKATIMASPDSEQVIQNILELVNYVYKLDNTGTLNTDNIAKVLIEYIGLDINREVLKALLDAAFAIKDIATDAADPVQLSATAVEIIANIILQMKYNDSITFNVVDAVPITNFEIDTFGMNPVQVKEGVQMQLGVKNVQPDAGNVNDIVWESSDPTIAIVDPKTGVVTGLDAGGSLGQLSSQTVEIIATSKANNVQKKVTVTVTGKTGKFLSYVDIIGDDMVDIDQPYDFGYQVYPARVAESSNLYTTWGMVTGEDEDGNEVISWADEENIATDGIGQIDYKGHYTAVSGGKSTIVLKAYTGYFLSNGNFYEISSYTARKEISTGIPVEKINIKVTDGTSNGDVNRDTKVTINGQEYEYITIHKGVLEGYAGNGAWVEATVEPASATNQKLTWVCDNNYYERHDKSDDTHKVTFEQKAGHEVADTFTIYAVSNDGKVVSNKITVCVTRNYANSNTIDQKEIECINGHTVDATHTVTFDGSWTGGAYACYDANWYSSDESVFSVERKAGNNDNCDAVISGNDVGVATLYCVSGDGGIVDTATVTVKPDKAYLKSIVDLCDHSVVIQTPENRAQYKQYMKKLDLAYAVLYDEDMASQTTCDTYAQNLLTAFYQLGGFVGIGSVEILGTKKTELKNKYVSVKVGSTSNYKNYSYDFDYKINPKNAMYSKAEWTSSNSNISVDANGKCTPTVNDPCSAVITCTITDYMGNKVSDSATIAFARTQATTVSISPSEIIGGKVGETKQLSAKISPINTFGNSTASCQDVTWVSSNTKIATVDKNGVVTFNYGGDCTIYCTTNDGGFTASCSINVVTNYDQLQLLLNQYRDLQLNSVNFYPDTWETYTNAIDKAQRMINKGGYKQDEVDEMYAELEASYKGLKKYTFIQAVELYLDGEQTQEFYQFDLSLLKEGISYKNAVLDLNVRLYPNNASYNTATWESSTSDISVTNDGKCSPTSNKSCYGRITCTVTDHFGNSYQDSVWVSFSYVPVTGLVLSDDLVNGNVGETHQMSCTVEPIGGIINIGDVISRKASIQDYYWESDDTSVATIDEDGVITFIGAGSTKIRAVSYDGGVSAECVVSTEGDRSVLQEAIDNYKNIDVTAYEYTYASAFNNAMTNAQNTINNKGAKQDQIDSAADALIKAYNEMVSHQYVKPESINITYTTYKKSTFSTSKVTSGTVGSNDAVSINLSSGYSNTNSSNYIELDTSVAPENAMYKSMTLDVVDGLDTNVSNAGTNHIRLTPNKSGSGAWVKLKATVTDHYDRVTVREIYVVMSDNTCTGISITQSSIDMLATDTPRTISATLSGNPEFKKIIWSSSNEDVAKVDESGVVTPVEKGSATITAKTLDGGKVAKVTVNVQTNFKPLADKVDEYNQLVNNSMGHNVYTDESLEDLNKVVAEAKQVVDEGGATQATVNTMLVKLEKAKDDLVKYELANGVELGFESNQYVSSPNNGYVRYTGTTINGKTIQLTKSLLPSDKAIYKSIEWSSSNSSIEVDSFGLVKNNSATAKAAVITCTVTDTDDISYSSEIVVSFVRYGANGLTFNTDMVYGAPQESVQLVPDLHQSSKSIQSSICNECIYTSSNPRIATVDNDGVVTFKSQGTTIITATSLDGGYVGTVKAYTTWDTTALKAAIAEGDKINYQDYAYTEGMAFKNALEAAKEVSENIYATQYQIDEATLNLTTAMTALEGNEFVSAELAITADDKNIENGLSYEVDSNNQVVVNASYNSDAMIKSATWSFENAENVDAKINGNTITLTKTGDDATITIIYTVVDDYDRESVNTYNINLVEHIVAITDFNLTYNGVETTDTNKSVSCGGTYNNFKGIQLGYVAYPEDATDPVSVEWASSAKTYITVSADGLVTLTSAGKVRASNNATITCTITNSDGTVVTKTITILITRA